MFFCHLGNACICLRIIQTKYQNFWVSSASCTQDWQPASIAVIDLKSVAAQKFYTVRIMVQNGCFNLICTQQAADRTSEMPKTYNDDFAGFQIFRYAQFGMIPGVRVEPGINKPVVYNEQYGSDTHRYCRDSHKLVIQLWAYKIKFRRIIEEHKSKFAYLRKRKCIDKVLVNGKFVILTDSEKDSEFDQQYRNNGSKNKHRIFLYHKEVDAGA